MEAGFSLCFFPLTSFSHNFKCRGCVLGAMKIEVARREFRPFGATENAL